MSPHKSKVFRRYDVEERQQFAALIREHGARATRELCKRTVATQTLLKIAREFGISLKKGRRRLRPLEGQPCNFLKETS
jgi:transposase-like protein